MYSTNHYDMRRRIWSALLTASDQEIHDGMNFYEGAHGLCRLIASVTNSTTRQVAGVYAALSPMNGWDTNVANTFDVLQLGDNASVNTSQANKDKAVRIAAGDNPDHVLKGRKVVAFFNGIANPSETHHIPVDRHLINLALGEKLDNAALSKVATSHYDIIEQAYMSLGVREGIGNRLASVAWFVERRNKRDQQAMQLVNNSLVCCGVPMHAHGVKIRRFMCRECGVTKKADISTRSMRQEYLRRKVVIDSGYEHIRQRVTVDRLNGRPRVFLGGSNQYANSGAWQWLARYIAMERLGRRLDKDEHTHHSNRNRLDCTGNNLEVWSSEHHGRYHANEQLLYMIRDYTTGRFTGMQC